MKDTIRSTIRKSGKFGVLLAVVVVAGCAAPRPEPSLDYSRRYHYPLLSPGTQFAELPPAVQRTIRAETGGTAIANIEKGTNDEQLVYRVIFQNPEWFPPLYVAPDGSLLNPNLTVAIPAPYEVVATKTAGPTERVTVQDLPPQVVKAIQAEAPDAEIGTITREHQGDKVIYIVDFKGRAHSKLYLGPDGTILRGARP